MSNRKGFRDCGAGYVMHKTVSCSMQDDDTICVVATGMILPHVTLLFELASGKAL